MFSHSPVATAGSADHALTAELVSLVDVPVVASGDITSRARAQAVLGTTGAEAVMVGRGAQGNPWALREIVDLVSNRGFVPIEDLARHFEMTVQTIRSELVYRFNFWR